MVNNGAALHSARRDCEASQQRKYNLPLIPALATEAEQHRVLRKAAVERSAKPIIFLLFLNLVMS